MTFWFIIAVILVFFLYDYDSRVSRVKEADSERQSAVIYKIGSMARCSVVFIGEKASDAWESFTDWINSDPVDDEDEDDDEDDEDDEDDDDDDETNSDGPVITNMEVSKFTDSE